MDFQVWRYVEAVEQTGTVCTLHPQRQKTMPERIKRIIRYIMEAWQEL